MDDMDRLASTAMVVALTAVALLSFSIGFVLGACI